jgi:hypothetical protein
MFYAHAAPNKRMQRRPRSESHMVLWVLDAAPLMLGVRPQEKRRRGYRHMPL